MRFLKYILAPLIVLLLVLCTIYFFKVRITPPIEHLSANLIPEVEVIDSTFFRAGSSSLRKNDKGLWEMYLEGGPLERGTAFGQLAKALNAEKETVFINEIKKRIPSDTYLNFLKYGVGWFNRDLDDHIPQEYLEEIYGSSLSLPDKLDYIGPKFHRAINYHAAHDIGHALQNMNLVGCTSFAVWGKKSERDKILLGRNFDFYFGKSFAEDKIIAFINPKEGHKFMSVTWACFSGVVSGMNEHGLTVTLNSAKSSIPTKGKTPVSIIARDMLQYARTIEEAFEIAKSYDSFVSETFLISSKIDEKVALIEKSQDETAIYWPSEDNLVVTNHFQSSELKDDVENLSYMNEEVSQYRQTKVENLIDELSPLNPPKVAAILRDKTGLKNDQLGLGNEKAINQLIAHHAVIFSPQDLVAWVSAPPYQLGEFVAYNLSEIFDQKMVSNHYSYVDSLRIDPDDFLQSSRFKDYQKFLQLKEKIQFGLLSNEGVTISTDEILTFKKSNADNYLVYYYLGQYYQSKKDWKNAIDNYKTGLTMKIARTSEKKFMEDAIKLCEQELKG